VGNGDTPNNPKYSIIIARGNDATADTAETGLPDLPSRGADCSRYPLSNLQLGERGCHKHRLLQEKRLHIRFDDLSHGFLINLDRARS
jgi:hypothetical protein